MQEQEWDHWDRAVFALRDARAAAVAALRTLERGPHHERARDLAVRAVEAVDAANGLLIEAEGSAWWADWNRNLDRRVGGAA